MPLAGFVADAAMAPRLARGHKAGVPEVDPESRDLPAGSLRASVDDLANFMRMVFAGGRFDGRRILERQSLVEMLRVQNDSVALDFDCRLGLAWMLSPCGGAAVGHGVKVAGHGGSTDYFNSQLLLSPDHKLGVVVLSNDADGAQEVGRIAATAMRLMLGAKTRTRPHVAEEPIPSLRRPDARQLAAIPGWYATSLGTLKVRARGERLLVDFHGTRIELLDDSRGRFHPRPANAVSRWLMEQTRDEADLQTGGLNLTQVGGREVVTVRIGGQVLMLGERIHPVPTPETWLAALGRYRVVNRGMVAQQLDEAVLRIEDGILLAEVTPVGAERKLRLALEPISDGEAVIYGLGWGLGETIRLEGGTEGPRLRYSGYELRRQEES